MAIYTRYGSQVKLLSTIDAGGWVRVQWEGGREGEVLAADLKADGGMDEIETSAEQFAESQFRGPRAPMAQFPEPGEYSSDDPDAERI